MFNSLLRRDENQKLVFSNKLIIGLVVIAILILIFIGKTPEEENSTAKIETEMKESKEEPVMEETEKRLEEILKKIDGAGDVSVMIYYSSMGEKIVASDTRTKSEKTERGEGLVDLTEDKEHSTVIYGGGSDEKPFVTEERLPKPGGIIILAEGAKNEKVRYEIQEAVRALLGLAPNRIRVVAKVQKYNE